jgi:hypothetical protein
MNSAIEVLRNEAKRLRSLADRLDAFALELNGGVPPARRISDPVINYYRDLRVGEGASPINPKEFKGMTQHAAILRALEVYGPQTTKELFNRLNAGGMAFKKPVYISAILGRLKDVVERTPDNRIKLREKNVAENPPDKQ